MHTLWLADDDLVMTAQSHWTGASNKTFESDSKILLKIQHW